MAKKTPVSAAEAVSEAGPVSVKLLVPRSGPAGSDARGAVIQVSAAEARRMLAAGQIEAPEGAVETATAAEGAVETATAAD